MVEERSLERAIFNDIIEHLEYRNEELQMSRKEWVDKAQASEKECQRLFEENEQLCRQLNDDNNEVRDRILALVQENERITQQYNELKVEYDKLSQLKGFIQAQDADKE
jgi:arsenate reductase-like glutaredoxin family protein